MTTRPLPAPSLAGFCVLANRVARERDPSFPTLRPGGLELVDEWYADTLYAADHRQDGRGWVLSLDCTYLGPGDVAEQNTWRAEAHGLGVVLVSVHRRGPPTEAVVERLLEASKR